MLNQGGYGSDIIKLTLEKLFASKRSDSIMDDEYSMPYKILALKETHWGLTYRKDLN